MERSEKRNVLLEYYPKGHHFHYNVEMHHKPDDCYLSLGWCSYDEADLFCTIVNPIIAKRRYDTPEIPFEIIKESWDGFCEMIEKSKVKI